MFWPPKFRADYTPLMHNVPLKYEMRPSLLDNNLLFSVLINCEKMYAYCWTFSQHIRIALAFFQFCWRLLLFNAFHVYWPSPTCVRILLRLLATLILKERRFLGVLHIELEFFQPGWKHLYQLRSGGICRRCVILLHGLSAQQAG